MAYLMDPKWNQDPWIRSLSAWARVSWCIFLSGSLRLRVPGLSKGVSPVVLSEEIGGVSVEEARGALDELCRPDRAGRIHLHYDDENRVVMIPNAPRYNHADNPNQVIGWFREWRDIPDSDLKFRHVEHLALGIDLQKESMRGAWEKTFGRVLDAERRGSRLRSYVDLSDRSMVQPPQSAPRNGFVGNGSGGNGSEHGVHRTPPVQRELPLPAPLDPDPSAEGASRRSSGPPETAPGRPLAATESPDGGRPRGSHPPDRRKRTGPRGVE